MIEVCGRSYGAFVSQLRAAQCGETCQAENSFSQADWEKVKTELAGSGGPDEFREFEAVQASWELTEALREPFGGSARVELGKLAAELEAALAPKPQSEAVGEWQADPSGWPRPLHPVVLAGSVRLPRLGA